MNTMNLTRLSAVLAAAVFAMTGCGGGGDGGSNSDAANTTAPTSTSQLASSYFDSLFLTSAGGGLSRFEKSLGSTFHGINGITKTTLSVASSDASKFDVTVSAVIGDVSTGFTSYRYVMADGQVYEGDDSNLANNIFSKTEAGFTANGTPSIPFATDEIRPIPIDLSGTPVSALAATYDLHALASLASSTAVFPPGSTGYSITSLPLLDYLFVVDTDPPFSTLEEAVSVFHIKGSIVDFCGYRVMTDTASLLDDNPNAEKNGVVY
ncbi:MAG: hypothetical protein ACTHKB_02070, partial [Burkholderiaceae bacterium]